ncbi:MAG: chorismate--pyruvate lyase [Dorea longicatena]
MLTCIYVVEKIDGDYAELRRVDALAQDQEENKVMARALLPADIMEGNKILYENLQYRIIADQQSKIPKRADISILNERYI